MDKVFADTGYYVGLLSEPDSLHDQAIAFSQSGLWTVTTDFVLLEVGNLVGTSRRRSAFPQLVGYLRSDPKTTILRVAPELFDAGLELYERRPDKEWSMTDCISFVVMEREGLTEALTADHHFVQAGFRALLQS